MFNMNLNAFLASESETSIAAANQSRSKAAGGETDSSGSDLFGIFCLK